MGRIVASQIWERRVQALPVVLVIEDDETIQGIVEDALDEGGFEMAVTSCAGANGLVRRMLLGTPLEAHSSAAAPVM